MLKGTGGKNGGIAEKSPVHAPSESLKIKNRSGAICATPSKTHNSHPGLFGCRWYHPGLFRGGKDHSRLSLVETLAAIDRTIIPGLERNLAGSAAVCADCIVHLTLTTAVAGVLLACVTACLAALGFVLETAFRIKFLFTGSENEFLTAVSANESFVLIHVIPLQF
jgi:hypothetical protein